MATRKEKQLAILLLKERLEHLTNKKVILEENNEVKEKKPYKEEDGKKALDIALRTYRNSGGRLERDFETDVSVNGTNIFINIPTDSRGPRTDHGGGDGDGWMSNSQIERAAAPYYKKYEPILKAIIRELKVNRFKAKGYIDYGEKGHISIQIDITK